MESRLSECSSCGVNLEKNYEKETGDNTEKHENILKARESFAKEKYGKAVSSLSQVAVKDPLNISVLFNLGRALTNCNDYYRALGIFDKGLKERPDSSHIWFSKGQCYFQMNEIEKSKECFQRSLETKPLYQKPRAYIKKCDEILEKRREAQSDFVAERSTPEREFQTMGRPRIVKDFDSTDGAYLCMACDSKVQFREEYQLWWCGVCSKHIDDDHVRKVEPAVDDRGDDHGDSCLSCGNKMRFISAYSDWWCDSCQTYLAEQRAEVDAQPSKEPEWGDESYCSRCGSPLSFIEEYDGWWCDSCQDYDMIEEEDHPVLKPTEHMDENSCQRCGRPLSYIDQYDAWWCDSCQDYAGGPEDHGEVGMPGGASPDHRCSKCGYPIVYVDQYDRWWCDGCRGYVEDDLAEMEPARVESGYQCQKCSSTLEFVENYQKWWCDRCHEYAGMDSPEDVGYQSSAFIEDDSRTLCRTCGHQLRFINDYQMWWCDDCQKYIGE